MISKRFKDYALDHFSIVRRMYGIKLKLIGENHHVATWFLNNHHVWDPKIPLTTEGVIVDVGAFKGEFTKKMLKVYPNSQYWLFEPVPEYAKSLKRRFHDHRNVKIFESAISSDGRELNFQVEGLRTRNIERGNVHSIKVHSTNIQYVFDCNSSIELLKLNIEGMEYECLEQLIESKSLVKVRYLLIQFHNFQEGDESRRDILREEIAKDFRNIYCFDWIWELWIRNESSL